MPAHHQRPRFIARIRAFPQELEAAVAGLNDAALDFRPSAGDWSIRQIVHHLADSHMNAYLRMKLALTEAHPTIKPYDQEAFAELPDTTRAPVAMSLALLRGLHDRWSLLMESLDEAQWSRAFSHPETGEQTVASLLDTYAEHCDNHLSQIARVKAALRRG